MKQKDQTFVTGGTRGKVLLFAIPARKEQPARPLPVRTNVVHRLVTTSAALVHLALRNNVIASRAPR